MGEPAPLGTHTGEANVIVWGSRGDTMNLGPQETKDCLTCERPRPFDLILQYRYGGLYWVFNFVMEKKYLLLCQACGRGWELDARQVEQRITKVSIPFMRRYGLASLAAVIGFFIFSSMVTSMLGKQHGPAASPAAPASTSAPSTVGNG